MKGCILVGGHGLSALGSRYEGGLRPPLGGMNVATAIPASTTTSEEHDVESEPRPLLNESLLFRLE